MNPALPDLNQRVLGFGGAASMVHPSSGYLVGGLLRRAPDLAGAIAAGLGRAGGSAEAAMDPAVVATQAWRASGLRNCSAAMPCTASASRS